MDKQKYRDAVQKGINWMCGQMNPDGTVNPVEKGAFAYYKLPWALAMAGRFEESEKNVRWIVAECMTDDGDFKSDKRSKFHLDYYGYENAWIVLAAHLLGLFDISTKGWAYIETLQDPQTGGICSRRPYDPESNGLEDPLSSAWVPCVGLHVGKLDMALRAAEFLQRIWDSQPDTSRQFYFWWRPKGGFIMSKPPEEPAERDYRISTTEPENWHYITGAQVAFLSKLYLVTHDPKHLALARRVRDFGMSCHDDLFGTDSAGKFCYGNSYLFRATGQRQYLETAIRCADYLCNDQKPDGCWMRGGKPTASSTAEFCVWMMSLLCLTGGVKEMIE